MRNNNSSDKFTSPKLSRTRLPYTKLSKKTPRMDVKLSMRESNMLREVHHALTKLGMNDHCVTNVVLSPDWRYASLYCISNINEDDAASAKALEAMTNDIGKIVKERCSGHFFPKLRFYPDQEARRQSRVRAILMSIPEVEEVSDASNEDEPSVQESVSSGNEDKNENEIDSNEK